MASDRTRERALLGVVGELVRELRRGKAVEVRLSSRLDRDLGIDSLGRTELILRVERAFRIRLGVNALQQAETVADVLHALEQAGPREGPGGDAAPVLPPLPAVSPAAEARTLPEVLDWHAAQHADRLHLTILQDDAVALATMTYRELADAARGVAAGLIGRDIVPGDRVALMLPTGSEFFTAFFGILYAGAVPVPIYPPARLSQLEDHLRRQAGILSNAGARILVTVPEALRIAGLLRPQVESLRAIDTAASLQSEASGVALPAIDPTATALIQYTSGSTGDPKGVVLTHANVLANMRAVGRAMEASSSDVFVSWLPLYHDMGLIGWLACLYFAAPFYVMSPLSFLARPETWLWTMHRTRATISAGPNFAFELCVSKIADTDLDGLDLRSLRMLANGAEPVNAQTLRRFADRFARYGFRPEALAPVYGLAENVVGLAFPPPGRGPLVDRVDREKLSRQRVAEPARPDDPRPLQIVACGQAIPEHEIRIVDESGREVGERREGRLEFRGPSATSGYFRNETKTRELIHDGWLDSGDRAYMAGGDVFITGRIKDILIRAGRNIYPQEIEEAIAQIPGIRKGGVALFGVNDRGSGTERLILLAETKETNAAARAALQARVNEVATDLIGGPPDEIVLAPPRTVPKTSSGKIRRSAAKQLHQTGRIGAPHRALGWQVVRLWLAGLGPRMRSLDRALGEYAYAAWWWVVLGLGALPAWVAVMVLPRLDWRWRAVRGVARAAFAALAVPISTIGIERIPRGNAVLAFNHASYVDALLLAAVLPGEPAFVAKRELASQLVAGPPLRRLGVLFVERHDVAGSLADAETVIAAARHGRALVFFPEGTFTRRPGLSAFYLGAFKTAAESGLPVFPGIIRGTRSMLRSNQWFPRRASLSVHIADAVAPSGVDFASVLRLRDSVREVVLAHCGEPDTGELMKPPPRLVTG